MSASRLRTLRALSRMEAIMKIFAYIFESASRIVDRNDEMVHWAVVSLADGNNYGVLHAIETLRHNVWSHESLRPKIKEFFDISDVILFSETKINPAAGKRFSITLYQSFQNMLMNDGSPSTSYTGLTLKEFLHVTRSIPLLHPLLCLGIALPPVTENDLVV